MYEYHGIGSFITLEGAELISELGVAVEVSDGENVALHKEEK
jgi:hypothetical protein